MIPRASSTGSQLSQTADYFNRPTISRTSTDLTPHLSQAPEFRVPTHEAPQKVMLPRRNTPTPHSMHAEWERDDAVTECHECRRRFTFLFRKVSQLCNWALLLLICMTARKSQRESLSRPLLTYNLNLISTVDAAGKSFAIAARHTELFLTLQKLCKIQRFQK